MSEVNRMEIQIEKDGEAHLADHFVKLLLDFAKGKTIAGYFLIRDNGDSHTVSNIEWAAWKNEEDLRKCLLDCLLDGHAPYAIFSVTATVASGQLQLNTSARKLDCFQAEKEDVNQFMNKTLDSYCEDFRQRAEAVIKAAREAACHS